MAGSKHVFRVANKGTAGETTYNLEVLPSAQRRSVGECYSLTPNPVEVYWGDEYTFVLCCNNCANRPSGSWYARDTNGIVIPNVGADFVGPKGDCCVSFRLTIPVGASQICIIGICINPQTLDACSRDICITASRAPTAIT